MTPDLVQTLGASGTNDTLLGILRQIAELQQRPLIAPENTMGRIGAAMSGMGAGLLGKESPVFGQLQAQREQQLKALQAQATIATAVRTTAHQNFQDALALAKSKREEEKERRAPLLGLYGDLIKHESPQVREKGFVGYKGLGMLGPEDDPKFLAQDPSYGFGKTPEELQAKDFYAEALAQGKPVSKVAARVRALEVFQKKDLTEKWADALMGGDPTLTRTGALAQALSEIEAAKRNPRPDLAREIAYLEKVNPLEAKRLMRVASELAIANSPKINMPRQIPSEQLDKLISTRVIARRFAGTLDLFDPAFVGVLGILKGKVAKFSDFPMVPEFRDRQQFAQRLFADIGREKKEQIGSARTPAELKDLAKYLPDPDEHLSISNFTVALENYVQGLKSELLVRSETLRAAGTETVDISADLAALDRGLAKLQALNRSDSISPSQYESLLRKGWTDAAIRKRYMIRGQ